ncbi:multiprotein bridging factor aMBF1 [Halobacterium litoreum]|uniref:Multiprotein bridging factor aMBF1 n=1 Tax=Halobacterium litoreum TaxID=2039234 RepID=A0ABD5NBD1_9EURY|nr:multiprotein bridging factor aMBF1 [Halobacterium litoreum]UHH14763.1 multiprotein bridging factor aMBF1 [Halobacterium litoreum]
MVQCEMCGADVPNPKTVKVEGAELDVCDDCADFGTEVKQESTSTTSTKYSTSSSSGGSSKSTSSGGSGGSSGGRRRRDMFDEMEEVASDYDQRIRSARESEGLSQEDLAQELNEKASVIRKLERGDSLPSDDVREKLEKHLGISLTESGGGDGDEEWSSSSDSAGLTLGDKVKRKSDDG